MWTKYCYGPGEVGKGHCWAVVGMTSAIRGNQEKRSKRWAKLEFSKERLRSRHSRGALARLRPRECEETLFREAGFETVPVPVNAGHARQYKRARCGDCAAATAPPSGCCCRRRRSTSR
jgi:hypothetical protein